MNSIGTSIELAVEHLQQGRIVAFPTETYYGLGVDPENEAAVEKLFKLKNRPLEKPLLLIVADLEQLHNFAASVPEEFYPLIEQHWPGPLTLIFPAFASVNRRITAGTGTVGMRISPHPVAEKLVRTFGRAITATSANIFGMAPAETAGEVYSIFGEQVDYIVDGGKTLAGSCSTVVGMSATGLQVLRAGKIDIFSS